MHIANSIQRSRTYTKSVARHLSNFFINTDNTSLTSTSAYSETLVVLYSLTVGHVFIFIPIPTITKLREYSIKTPLIFLPFIIIGKLLIGIIKLIGLIDIFGGSK